MRISKAYAKYIILLAPLFLSLTSYAIFSNIFGSILLIAKMLILTFLITIKLSKKNLTRFDVMLLLFMAVYLFSVVLNGGNIVGCVKELAMVMCYALVTETAIDSGQKEIIQMIKAAADILLLLLFLNAVFCIMKPLGIYASASVAYGVSLEKTRYNFLGLDNSTTPVIIVAVVIWQIAHRIYDRKVTLYMAEIMVLILNAILISSATLYVAYGVILLLTLLYEKWGIQINRNVLVIGIVSLFVIFVIFNAQSMFSTIIVIMLKKDISLTSRTLIWSETVKYIIQKPILGHGIGTYSYVYSDRNAHNLFLQILAQMGVVGFIAWLNMIYTGFYKATKSGINYYMVIGFFSYFICCISEVYELYWSVVLTVLLYYGYVFDDLEIH